MAATPDKIPVLTRLELARAARYFGAGGYLPGRPIQIGDRDQLVRTAIRAANAQGDPRPFHRWQLARCLVRAVGR